VLCKGGFLCLEVIVVAGVFAVAAADAAADVVANSS